MLNRLGTMWRRIMRVLRGAGGAGRLDELLLFELQGLATHIARHQRPGRKGQRQRDQQSGAHCRWGQ